MSPCPDEGETGEDPPGDHVTVAASDHRYAFDGVNLPSTNAEIAVPGDVVEIGRANECGAVGEFLDNEHEYPYYRCGVKWDGTQAADWMDNRCVSCDNQGGMDHVPGSDDNWAHGGMMATIHSRCSTTGRPVL